MSETVKKAIRMTMLITDNPRITVRRIRAELGLSRSAAYRWLRWACSEMPIRIDDGVVCSLEADDEDKGSQP